MIKMIHSYWAYIVLIVLIFAVVNAFIGLRANKKFEAKDLRIALFALMMAFLILFAF